MGVEVGELELGLDFVAVKIELPCAGELVGDDLALVDPTGDGALGDVEEGGEVVGVEEGVHVFFGG